MVAFARFVNRGHRRGPVAGEHKLPLGAEAAVWSILEAVPDPRNHLALTRDLSGEVHLADHERAAVVAAFDEYIATTKVAGDESVIDESVVDVRDTKAIVVDSDYDLGVINENAPLTDDLFTSAES